MKFDYSKDGSEKCVAVLHYLANGPERCLVIKAEYGKAVWFYPDGVVSVQDDDMEEDDNPIAKFYKGDKVTITF